MFNLAYLIAPEVSLTHPFTAIILYKHGEFDSGVNFYGHSEKKTNQFSIVVERHETSVGWQKMFVEKLDKC